jgi:hypothetical protein
MPSIRRAGVGGASGVELPAQEALPALRLQAWVKRSA